MNPMYCFEKLMHRKYQISSIVRALHSSWVLQGSRQVKQKKDGIFISQDKYVAEILKKFGFTDVKTASTLMETQKPLLKDEDGKEIDVHLYRSMISSLMYLRSSRPDIMFVVCACARYQVNPKVSHLHAVKRIFRYLKGQPKLGLWYPKDYPFDLVPYTYSDYAGASLNRKSITRSCQFLRCRLISWQCKKQTMVANSTTKPEYVAASSCQQLDDVSTHKRLYVAPSHTKKIFANMRRVGKGFSGRVTPLFPTMVVQSQSQLGEGSAIPTDPQHTPTITQPSTSQPQKTQKPRKPKIKDTQIPQYTDLSGNVTDEAVHKELGDRLVRHDTTTSSLEE
ncbi:hypothetical protein Tco_0794293 [Tanacetum coccineum]